MPKNIIALSDGTGNSSAKLFKTNVWRTYEALDLSNPKKQIAYYDDGVGNSSIKPLALLGGAIGLALLTAVSTARFNATVPALHGRPTPGYLAGVASATTSGFDIGFAVGAGILIVGAATALLTIRVSREEAVIAAGRPIAA